MTTNLDSTCLLPSTGTLAFAPPALLGAYNEAGVLDSADIRIACTLLNPDSSPLVQLGVALTIRALRHGSVCHDITSDPADLVAADDPAAAEVTLPPFDPEALRDALQKHPQVSSAAQSAPLCLRGDLLYLEKYLEQEQLVATTMASNGMSPVAEPDRIREALARLFPGPGPDRQRLAAACVLSTRITVLAGGPGTGKTTTIASIVAMLRLLQPTGRILFAAPTGKAAARLSEATNHKLLESAFDHLPPALRSPIAATTVHRMLGSLPGSRTRFRHNRTNPLPADTIVVDEASMISLSQMARLFEALRPSARLLLVGDPEQLVSVDAGAVLADITRSSAPAITVPAIRELAAEDEPDSVSGCGVVTLKHNYRSSDGIADLARAIRAGDVTETLVTLERAPEIEYVAELGVPDQAPSPLRDLVREIAVRTAEAAEQDSPTVALAALERHRLLCAHRRGPQGVSTWAAAIRAWVGAPSDERHYPGQPLLVTSNDYQHGLFNGDVGVVVRTETGLQAVFRRQGGVIRVHPGQLESPETPYAMTIHRGQGSEFDEVTVVLPDADSPLLTRELFYTAVTRARSRLRVIAEPRAIEQAVSTRVRRASGLSL